MGYAQKVALIGAGISGLACAYRLKQLEIPFVAFEAQERPGGLISTIRRNGFLFETGPQCPRFPHDVWQLVRELGLEKEFVAGDSKAKRYILRDNRLLPAPFSPARLFGTELIGFRAKLRILTEVFRSSEPPPREESLAEFVQRKFGAEVLDYLVDPLISTIFFGDAHKMGMDSAFPALVQWERDQGSLVRGAIRARNLNRRIAKENSSPQQSATNPKADTLRVTDSLPSLGSFHSGMAALPERLAAELHQDIHYRAAIASIEQNRTGNSGAKAAWRIIFAGGETLACEHLILAVPAHVAGQLLTSAAPELAAQLIAIEYAPVCVVGSAYNRSQVANPLDGFGYMVPRREGLETICTFWNSSLFPGRAPAGKVVITSFAGRSISRNGLVSSEETCARTVEAENTKALGIMGSPQDRVIWKEPRALPQYNVGHAQRVLQIQRYLQSTPNLSLVGNFLKGRSVGDCVDVAFAVAREINSRLRGDSI